MSLADKIPGWAPDRKVTEVDDGFVVTVTPPDFMAMPPESVLLTPDQYERYKEWRNGLLLIQDALPELSPEDLERLMSGIGPAEWQDMWVDESEESAI